MNDKKGYRGIENTTATKNSGSCIYFMDEIW